MDNYLRRSHRACRQPRLSPGNPFASSRDVDGGKSDISADQLGSRGGPCDLEAKGRCPAWAPANSYQFVATTVSEPYHNNVNLPPGHNFVLALLLFGCGVRTPTADCVLRYPPQGDFRQSIMFTVYTRSPVASGVFLSHMPTHAGLW